MSGTIQNRDAFLKNIANSLGRNQAKTKMTRPKWSFNPQDKTLQGLEIDDLVEVLKKQCTVIHTNFLLTTKQELPEIVRETVKQYEGGPVVTWKDTRFEQFGLKRLLYEELPAENIAVHEWDATRKEENIELAEKANIGITISDITLAESGTVVLFSSKDKGRTVSFLPAKSIMIIPKSSIVPRMTQAARIIRKKIKNGEHLASCINFITGPSNSADIELNLVVGVHGPFKATYIVVDDL